MGQSFVILTSKFERIEQPLMPQNCDEGLWLFVRVIFDHLVFVFLRFLLHLHLQSFVVILCCDDLDGVHVVNEEMCAFKKMEGVLVLSAAGVDFGNNSIAYPHVTYAADGYYEALEHGHAELVQIEEGIKRVALEPCFVGAYDPFGGENGDALLEGDLKEGQIECH